MAKQRNWDLDWGEALELLQQFKNPDGVLALLAAGAPVPDRARKEIAKWRAGLRPPWPGPRDDNDVRLLAAVRAYHDKTTRRPKEKRELRIKRIAAEHQIRESWLEDFLNHEGSRYRRLGRDNRRWEQIYFDPNLFDD